MGALFTSQYGQAAELPTNPRRSHRLVLVVRPPIFLPHLSEADRSIDSDPSMVDSTARVGVKRGLSKKRKGIRGLGEKPEVRLGSLSMRDDVDTRKGDTPGAEAFCRHWERG